MPTLQHPTEDQNEIRNATDRVVVVAARYALGDYLKYSAYVCQPHRSFQPCARMAFYTKHKIDRHIPKIVRQIEAIGLNKIESRTDLTESERAKVRTLLNELGTARGEDWSKKQLKIVFLTAPSSPETLVLSSDIENNSTARSGQSTPFTQGQRYVSLARLEKGPKTTSELV